MPNVGYCHDCGEWVYVLVDWSCPKGHPASRVNGWYNSDSGKPIAAPAAAVDAFRDVREAFIADLITTIALYPAYSARRAHDTDIAIASNPVDATWSAGKTRADYHAAIKVVESQRAVYFWEALEHRRGDGVATGADPASGDPIVVRDAGRSGIGASMEWGYGTTRGIIEPVAGRHGLMLKTVLRRSSALW